MPQIGTKFLRGLFENMYIADFGTAFLAKEDKLILSINYAYKHPNGGSNGHRLFRVAYSFRDNSITKLGF